MLAVLPVGVARRLRTCALRLAQPEGVPVESVRAFRPLFQPDAHMTLDLAEIVRDKKKTGKLVPELAGLLN
jgi:hypothetical protein